MKNFKDLWEAKYNEKELKKHQETDEHFLEEILEKLSFLDMKILKLLSIRTIATFVSSQQSSEDRSKCFNFIDGDDDFKNLPESWSQNLFSLGLIRVNPKSIRASSNGQPYRGDYAVKATFDKVFEKLDTIRQAEGAPNSLYSTYNENASLHAELTPYGVFFVQKFGLKD